MAGSTSGIVWAWWRDVGLARMVQHGRGAGARGGGGVQEGGAVLWVATVTGGRKAMKWKEGRRRVMSSSRVGGEGGGEDGEVEGRGGGKVEERQEGVDGRQVVGARGEEDEEGGEVDEEGGAGAHGREAAGHGEQQQLVEGKGGDFESLEHGRKGAHFDEQAHDTAHDNDGDDHLGAQAARSTRMTGQSTRWCLGRGSRTWCPRCTGGLAGRMREGEAMECCTGAGASGAI